jgi:phosphoribosylamine--glycine ligase
MQKYNIPTAKFQTAEGYNDALSIIKNCDFPIVIKADGLALGKGVSICGDYAEAEKALRETMLDKKFGASGNRVVIEEFLTGPEVSVLTFTDGKTIAPMVGSMDHKRAADGDKGPNTGGMGAIAPNPFYTKEIADECMKKIFLPTINAMNEEGRKFKGCLYFGLMLTPIGPKVIEYNCRFGDPEAQTVLPLLKTDLFEIMKAVYEERLDEINVEFAPGAAACVVVASGGYPGKYETGFEINGLADCGATVFHAGTKKADGKYFTASGRVLGITATGGDLSEALQKAYGAVEKISFTNMFYRKDIGKYSRMPGGAR